MYLSSPVLLGVGAALLQTVRAANPSIDSALYNKFVRYTKFAAASYSSNCANPPGDAVVVQYFSNSSSDTQATLFRDDTNKDIIIAFRGTSTIQDFLTDSERELVPYDAVGVDCSDCNVHIGWHAQWKSVSSAVVSALSTQVSSYPTYTLVATGHSMGGAIASLATGSLIGLGYDVTTYTFGQPRTGDPAYANYIDEITGASDTGSPGIYRVTHAYDGVPQIPTTSDGYRHHRTEFWANDPASAANTVRCTGQEPADCNLSKPGYGIGEGVIGINLDHLSYFGISIGNPLDGGSSSCS